VGTRIERTLYDDLDNSIAATGTFQFGLEGVEYDIDLSENHLGDLRAALARSSPPAAAGRRRPRTATGRRRATASSQSDRDGARAWWRDNAEQYGLPEYRSHGRVPDVVRTAFNAHR
jgi:hypothetical protein